MVTRNGPMSPNEIWYVNLPGSTRLNSEIADLYNKFIFVDNIFTVGKHQIFGRHLKYVRKHTTNILQIYAFAGFMNELNSINYMESC